MKGNDRTGKRKGRAEGRERRKGGEGKLRRTVVFKSRRL